LLVLHRSRSPAGSGRPEPDEPAVAARLAALIERLGDNDFKARTDARLQLVKLGQPARAALVRAMTGHADLEVRLLARRALVRIIDEKLTGVVARLGDDSFTVQQAAARELVKLCDAPITSRPGSLRADIDLESREAFRVLTWAAARHPDGRVRRNAAAALSQSLKERITGLIRQLGDDDYGTRQGAQAALIQIGLPALVELRRAESNPDLEVRSRAIRIVQTITSGR
jgi:HEAT repeat protein